MNNHKVRIVSGWMIELMEDIKMNMLCRYT